MLMFCKETTIVLFSVNGVGGVTMLGLGHLSTLGSDLGGCSCRHLLCSLCSPGVGSVAGLCYPFWSVNLVCNASLIHAFL